MNLNTNPKSRMCRLCHKPRELRNSHIIPEFAYRPIYDATRRARCLDGETGVQHVAQKGRYERMLCGECEGILQHDEHYFSLLWHQRDPLPDPVDAVCVDRAGFQFDPFFRFHLSVLWRASVARDAMFSAVSLGPFEEALRLFLPGTFQRSTTNPVSTG